MKPTKTFKGKQFLVTIDRSTMERGYVLQTINKDGTTTEMNSPLKQDEFQQKFGFSPEWPHEKVTKGKAKTQNKVFGLVCFEEPGQPWTRVQEKYELIKQGNGECWDGEPHWEIRLENGETTHVPISSVVVLPNDNETAK